MSISIQECSSDIDFFTQEEWNENENSPDVRIRFLNDPGVSGREYVYCAKKEAMEQWLADNENKSYFWVPIDPNHPIGDDGEWGRADHSLPIYRLPSNVYIVDKEFMKDNVRDYIGIPVLKGLVRVGIERFIVSGSHGQIPGSRVYLVIPYSLFDTRSLESIIDSYIQYFRLSTVREDNKSLSELVDILQSVFALRPVEQERREERREVQEEDADKQLELVLYSHGYLCDINNLNQTAVAYGDMLKCNGKDIRVGSIECLDMLRDHPIVRYISNGKLWSFDASTNSNVALIDTDVESFVQSEDGAYILLRNIVYHIPTGALIPIPSVMINPQMLQVTPLLIVSYNPDNTLYIFNVTLRTMTLKQNFIPDIVGYELVRFVVYKRLLFGFFNGTDTKYILTYGLENPRIVSDFIPIMIRDTIFYLDGYKLYFNEYWIDLEGYDEIKIGSSINQLLIRLEEGITRPNPTHKILTLEDRMSNTILDVGKNGDVLSKSGTDGFSMSVPISGVTQLKFMTGSRYILGIDHHNPGRLYKIDTILGSREIAFDGNNVILDYGGINDVFYVRLLGGGLHIPKYRSSYIGIKSSSFDRISGYLYFYSLTTLYIYDLKDNVKTSHPIDFGNVFKILALSDKSYALVYRDRIDIDTNVGPVSFPYFGSVDDVSSGHNLVCVRNHEDRIFLIYRLVDSFQIPYPGDDSLYRDEEDIHVVFGENKNLYVQMDTEIYVLNDVDMNPIS